MIPELNDGERQGNIVLGADEEGVYTGSDVDRLAGRMVGKVLGFGKAHTEREYCAVFSQWQLGSVGGL